MKQKEYLAGSSIFKEGEECTSSYLIKEGEVNLIREKSVLDYLSAYNDTGKNADKTLQAKRGFLSKSLEKFQLGVAISGQWIGEDYLMISTSKYLYSATASTKVVCFEFPKQNLEGLPSEIIETLKGHILERKSWMNKRMKDVGAFVDSLLKETQTIDFTENMIEMKKKYPLATLDVLDCIRKKKLSPTHVTITQNLEPSPAITKLSLQQSLSALNIGKYHKLRSLYRLGDKSSMETLEAPMQYGFSKYLECTPLSFASSTKPLNGMFPIKPKQNKKKRMFNNRTRVKPLQIGENVRRSEDYSNNELGYFCIGKKAINVLACKNTCPPTPNPFRDVSSK